MIVKQLIEVFDTLDSADASGLKVKEYLESKGATNVEVVKREKDGKSTDFVKVVIPGSNGRLKGGNAPSLGIIGRLGGIGARPERIGFVSDGDGALTALAAAAKILDMNSKKDFLPGDVYICTHVCPHAPTAPHIPVPFMGSPIDMAVMNEMEVCPEMEAVLSIDTTRGNRLINNNGVVVRGHSSVEEHIGGYTRHCSNSGAVFYCLYPGVRMRERFCSRADHYISRLHGLRYDFGRLLAVHLELRHGHHNSLAPQIFSALIQGAGYIAACIIRYY